MKLTLTNLPSENKSFLLSIFITFDSNSSPKLIDDLQMHGWHIVKLVKIKRRAVILTFLQTATVFWPKTPQRPLNIQKRKGTSKTKCTSKRQFMSRW